MFKPAAGQKYIPIMERLADEVLMLPKEKHRWERNPEIA